MKKLLKESLLIRIFLSFFKIGLFTFGGGYAMIALMEHEFVGNKNWLTKDEFLDMTAIAESTPGPIAINSATYIGYRVAGILGSVVGTLGVVLPSFIIIYIVSLFFDAFLSLKVVACAFHGIQICVVYLIASASVKMFKGLKKTPLSIIIFSVTVVAFLLNTLFSTGFSSILFILLGGIVGIVCYLISRLSNKKGGSCS